MVELPYSIIGVDESGKGDFFGPLAVAGFAADRDELGLLHELGVRDSKKIADAKILKIDDQLRARFAFELVVLMPEAYNSRYDQIRNLNKLLAEGHARVIASLQEKRATVGRPVDLAISDKFGKTERLVDALAHEDCRLPVKQMVRGEVIPQVAAASIIARAEFLRSMSRLSADWDMTIPKGAGPLVDVAGREFVNRHGAQSLSQVAKLHFKNFQRVTAGNLFETGKK